MHSDVIRTVAVCVLLGTLILTPRLAPAPIDSGCPHCTISLQTAKLTGTIHRHAVGPFPWTNMTLVLRSKKVVEVFEDLPPAFQYPETVVDQAIETNLDHVDQAELLWLDAEGVQRTQAIKVVTSPGASESRSR